MRSFLSASNGQLMSSWKMLVRAFDSQVDGRTARDTMAWSHSFEKGVEPSPKVASPHKSALEDSSESGSRLCSMNRALAQAAAETSATVHCPKRCIQTRWLRAGYLYLHIASKCSDWFASPAALRFVKTQPEALQRCRRVHAVAARRRVQNRCHIRAD